jgi:tripartite-type tricarboxylate transporter receptor subunit TctC
VARGSRAFPDLPTLKALGFRGVEFYIWAELFVPRAVPKPGCGKVEWRGAF